MRFRVNTTPWGAARFTYSYLGTVIAGAIAGLITVIANPIVNALPVCRADQEGTCTLTLTGIVGLLVLFAAFFLAAHVLRLGWGWAAWFTALILIMLEIIIEFNTFAPAWSLIILPALACLITFERPDHPPSKSVRTIRLAALVIALVQFVIWFILLLMT